MRNVIIDSSSAILLYRCNMTAPLLKYCSPVIPRTVFAELTVPGYDGADIFTGLCRDGEIKVYQTEPEIKLQLTGSLHAGERDVIFLFKQGKGDFIIIDDGKGGGYCRDNNIPYINALLAVKILLMKNLITETEYADAWNWLLLNGRYSEKVKVWAGNADREKLDFFI